MTYLKHSLLRESILRVHCLAASSGGRTNAAAPPRGIRYLTRRRSMLLMLATIQLLPLLVYFSMLFSNFCLMLFKNPAISLSIWIGAALLEKYTTASFSTVPYGNVIFRMVVLVTVCAFTFSPCWRQCCKMC